MKTGTEALETWVPLGGFRLDRRKGKTPEGEFSTTDWLVPVLAYDGVSPGYPCADQPCPHNQVIKLASLYGLLTATGKIARAGALPPEPVEIWHREIRSLRNATTLWDAITAGEETALRRAIPQHQAAKREKSDRPGAGTPGPESNGKIGRRQARTDRPARRRVLSVHHPPPAREAHRRHLADCLRQVPGPTCGRWFLRSAGRGDRQYCCHACQMRAWRATTSG